MGYASARRGTGTLETLGSQRQKPGKHGAARAFKKTHNPKTKTGKGRLLRKQTPFSLATNYLQWAEARNIVWRK